MKLETFKKLDCGDTVFVRSADELLKLDNVCLTNGGKKLFIVDNDSGVDFKVSLDNPMLGRWHFVENINPLPEEGCVIQVYPVGGCLVNDRWWTPRRLLREDYEKRKPTEYVDKVSVVMKR